MALSGGSQPHLPVKDFGRTDQARRSVAEVIDSHADPPIPCIMTCAPGRSRAHKGRFVHLLRWTRHGGMTAPQAATSLPPVWWSEAAAFAAGRTSSRKASCREMFRSNASPEWSSK